MTVNPINRLLTYLTPFLCFQSIRKLPCLPMRLSKLSHPCFSFGSSTTNQIADEAINSREQIILTLLNKCSTMKYLTQIYAHILQTGFDQNVFLVGKIVSFCTSYDLDNINYAVSVFDQIRNPDGFLWNTMIRGFGQTGQVENAFHFYKKMQEKGKSTDNFTFSFLLKICGQFGLAHLGKQIHCNSLKHGLEFHVFVRNTLLHMYGTFKEIKVVLRLFEEISKPDLVAWNTLIDSHVYCGLYKEALDLFLQMLQTDIKPDETTLVVTLSACSSLSWLDFGKQVHSFIQHSCLAQPISVSNSLIDMYAKCGQLDEAIKIFNEMNEMNIVSWNSIILGLAHHGHAEEALEFFSRLIEEKLLEPNDVTFLGVSCACRHRGLVEEGRRYFSSMINDYGINPTIMHYGCMVDLLGRAGFLEEAYNLIRTMPIECNAIVWRTLFGACRVHGNVEVGEKIRRHLRELEPDHSGDYVLAADLYATSEQWNEVVRIRKSMRERRVRKPKPGNSFIDIHSNKVV